MKIIKNKNVRFFPNRFQIKEFEKNNSGILGQINSFLQENGNNYLGFGGLGDLILLLANCYNDNQAKVLFFANDVYNSILFLNTFGLKHLVFQNIMGQPLANSVYNLFQKSNFKISSHLSDGLNNNDWKNEAKYISRINSQTNWMNKFGFDKSKNILIICPHGSNRDDNRRRYLNHQEYNLLLSKYESEFDEIYVTGSNSDFEFYGPTIHQNVFYLTFDSCSNLKQFFKIVNSSKLVISVDTWLKTYSCLANIHTKVIKTRWNGCYKNFGEDISDYIFLNKKIYKSLELVEFEQLMNS